MLLSLISIAVGILCAFAHPAEGFQCAFLIAFLPGAILFLTRSSSRVVQFWSCTLFYSAFCIVSFRWLSSHLLVDSFLLMSWFSLSFVLGLGFGLFSLFCRAWKGKEFLGAIVLSLFWCAIEWSRHLLFSGCPWLPLGAYAAGNSYYLQWASIFGVYGLSFSIMLLNLLFTRFLIEKRSLRGVLSVGTLIVGLTLIGSFRIALRQELVKEPIAIGVIQTGVYPHHKMYLRDYFDYWVPAESMMADWIRVACESSVAKTLLLPECVFSFAADMPKLHLGAMSLNEHTAWMNDNFTDLPSLITPLSAFKMMAKKYSKQIIVGLDCENREKDSVRFFNSAFSFTDAGSVESSAKSILVPFGEYPTWLHRLFFSLPRGGEFDFGSMNKSLFRVEDSLFAMTSICFEDAFPHLVRKWLQGADLHFNITNDGWIDSPLLWRQHFIHSQLRSVENGIATLRASATGPSAYIDQYGQILQETPMSPNIASPTPLYAEWRVDAERIPTVYSHLGDLWVLFAILFSIIYAWFSKTSLFIRLN